MAVLHKLHCDDGLFAGWTYTTKQSPSVIEQIAAAAHDGARGNHIVVNEDMKAAYASLENWATAMSVGELRAVGFWWKVLVPVPPTHQTVIAALGVGGNFAAALWVNYNNAVKLSTYHYDEVFTETDYVPLFTGTEWHHVRLVIIRHATAGGAQLWDGNNLLIDDTEHNTAAEYEGTPDWFHVGACEMVKAGFETCQDEFRIATTRVEANPDGGYWGYVGDDAESIDYDNPVAYVAPGTGQMAIVGLGLAAGGSRAIVLRARSDAGVEETNTAALEVVVDANGVIEPPVPAPINYASARAVAGAKIEVRLTYVNVVGQTAASSVQIAEVVDGSPDWENPLATVTLAAQGATRIQQTLDEVFDDGELVTIAMRPVTAAGGIGETLTLPEVLADATPPAPVDYLEASQGS